MTTPNRYERAIGRNAHEEHAEVIVRLCHADDDDATKCAYTNWKMTRGIRTGSPCHQFAGFAITAANGTGVIYRRCALHIIDAVREASTDWLNFAK